MYTYLLLDLAILGFPLALSFDKKVAFHKKWKYIWQGILLNLLIFLPWDVAFTDLGVWGFNPDYLIGIEFFQLPLEEYLFFLVVPYAAIFIYACLEAYFPKDMLYRFRKGIAWAVIFICLLFYFYFDDHLYSAVATLYLSFTMLMVLISGKHHFLGRFFMTYLIICIPFLICNGILTGLPVVWYNDMENLGIRIFSIPADDLIYNMGMLLIPLGFYARNTRK